MMWLNGIVAIAQVSRIGDAQEAARGSVSYLNVFL